MEIYEDRPISVYDNLTMPQPGPHTSLPKKKMHTSPATATTNITPAAAAATATTQSPKVSIQVAAINGGATHSPYSDISFKFNETHQQQQPKQQEQQQQHVQSRLLPNGVDQSLLKSSQPAAGTATATATATSTSIQMQPKTAYYSTPFKSASSSNTKITTPTTPTTPTITTITTTQPTLTITSGQTQPSTNSPPISPQQLTKLTTASPVQSINAITAAPIADTTAKTVTSIQRPLSQHLQSEQYEASHSIAAVKAALNDAKSKFFGLDGYAAGAAKTPSLTSAATTSFGTPALSENNSNNLLNESLQADLLPSEQIKVQIVKPLPPPKPRPPKYQNIPENSAIFRSQQPPELPPKPIDRQKLQQSSAAATITNDNGFDDNLPATLPQFREGITETDTSTRKVNRGTSPMNTGMGTQSDVFNQQTGKAIGINQYRQIPLNDIDNSQPSQAVYMSTTVPQNIKGSKIAGRHTPTRNSLRHSRMLVVNNKNYQATQHPNPMDFKYPNFARWLLILELFIGVLISFLAVWIFFLAPNTTIQYNPYWSGLILILSGTLGLVLVRYQRTKRHKVRENCFMFLRAFSYLVSLIALLLCIVAVICASIHYARLTAEDTKCEPTNPLLEHGSCTCTFNAAPTNIANTANVENAVNEELGNDSFDVDRSYKVEYRELSCIEVTGEWIYLLNLSIVFNTLAFIVSMGYITILACCRQDSKRFYASVHTSTF